jgi:hypothetical protein
VIVGVGAILVMAISLASANTTNGPRALADYGWETRTFPKLEVVLSTYAVPTAILAEVTCLTYHPFDQRFWNSTVHLHNNAFSIDREVSINAETAQPGVRHYKGTVRVTARFAAGEFVGQAYISGTACRQSTYKTTYGGINHLGAPPR